MNRFFLTIFTLLFITTCFFTAGCNNSHSSTDIFKETAFQPVEGNHRSESAEPMTIHLAVNDTYCKNSACACVQYIASREYEALQEMLLLKFKIDLQLTYFIDEYELEDALSAQKFDGVICKPWLAFMLVPGQGIKYARIADLLDPFETQMLTGIFLVKNDSPIKSLDDVTGKRLVIGQEDSFEKYHMPFMLMEKNQIKPKKLFQRSSCTENISMMLDDSVDVAVVSDYALIASCAADLGKEDDFRIIAKTEEIPLCSVIIDLAKVSEKNALILQKALLELSGKNSPKSMLSRGFVKPAKWTPSPYLKDKIR